ncbi:MAG TPA: hypothetical protein PK910_03470 [Bacteroidales bacterium]|nr:hypothetical protein [Bacteroidales bacterium]HRC89065.1 hypothetical protein [Bacteroidales bacterium]
MELQNQNRIVKKSNVTIKISAIIAVLFTAYFVILSIIAPSKKIAYINKEFGYKKPEKGAYYDSIFFDSTFITLNREKSFYQARIAMATSDSVSLSVNLPDSSAILEINGVPVYNIKIIRARISKVFANSDEYAVSSMLSTPFNIIHDYSTIKKEPVVHKVAPRDTTEYKPDAPPDTSKTEYVNVIFETREGVRLHIFQETNGNSSAFFHRCIFDLNDRFRNAFYILKCMVNFKTPDYHPYIKLYIPAREARIIYRALPQKGQFAIFR